MLKNLVHLTLLSYLWKRYKAIVIATVILFAYFFLIGKLHDDFVNYSQLNNDSEYLGTSFVLKWLLYLLGCAVYIFYNNRILKSKTAKTAAENTVSPSLSKRKTTNKNQAQVHHTHAADNQSADPFQQIREKEVLRSKADVVIDKK